MGWGYEGMTSGGYVGLLVAFNGVGLKFCVCEFEMGVLVLSLMG